MTTLTILIPLVAIIVLIMSLLGLFRGNLRIKVLCGILALLLLAGLLAPFPRPGAIQRARAIQCGNDLRHIFFAIEEYRAANSNDFSITIQSVAEYISYPITFFCKGVNSKSGVTDTSSEWTNYTFILPPDTNNILGYCSPDNHYGELGVVLFSGGAVKILPSELFQKTIGE